MKPERIWEKLKRGGGGRGEGQEILWLDIMARNFLPFFFFLSLSLSFSIVKTNRSIEQTSLGSCFHIFQRLDDIENFYAAANDKIQATWIEQSRKLKYFAKLGLRDLFCGRSSTGGKGRVVGRKNKFRVAGAEGSRVEIRGRMGQLKLQQHLGRWMGRRFNVGFRGMKQSQSRGELCIKQIRRSKPAVLRGPETVGS